ncbi:MAG: CoA ester lyase [Acetobacteraceae bacterium]|nr:CoA ester lyase [Acetobacteraceae bacterium]
MRLRSLLFAPGDAPRKIDKALDFGADGVILDLEDSVAAAAKDTARAQVAARLPSLAARGDIVVRINPRGTPWYLADLAAVVPGRPTAILLPKCTGPHDLAALDHHLEALETASGQAVGRIRLLALVTETAASLLAMPGPGAAGMGRVLAFCFGAEDLSSDLGIPPRLPDQSYPAAIAHARGAMLVAAAAAGVAALDTPWPDHRDPVGLAREAGVAAADGFAGKVCIHPDQVAPVNAAFTPDPAQVAWAEKVRDGFAANPNSGVFALDGKMIDRPHLRLAERILSAAGRGT